MRDLEPPNVDDGVHMELIMGSDEEDEGGDGDGDGEGGKGGEEAEGEEAADGEGEGDGEGDGDGDDGDNEKSTKVPSYTPEEVQSAITSWSVTRSHADLTTLHKALRHQVPPGIVKLVLLRLLITPCYA